VNDDAPGDAPAEFASWAAYHWIGGLCKIHRFDYALLRCSGEMVDLPYRDGDDGMSHDEINHDKPAWEPMKLTYVGDVGDIIKNEAGQGKSSVSADSGDIHKPPGQG
jgi:hypothetical protein